LLDGVLTTTGVGEGAGVAAMAAAAGAAPPTFGMAAQPERANAKTNTPIHAFVIFVFAIM